MIIWWTLSLLFSFISLSNGYFPDMYQHIDMSKCAKFKNEFANVTSQTVSCFIKSSQPLRICSSCKPEFAYLQGQYNALVKGRIGVYENTNCADNLLRSDITSAIHELYAALGNEWDAMNCDNCYENQSNNFTEAFQKFLDLETIVMQCLSLYTNASLDYLSPYFETIWDFDSFNDTACTQCNTLYWNLNKYYNIMSNSASDSNSPQAGLCGDIVDIMNTTRYLWSWKFSCDNMQADMVLVTPIFVILGFVLIFYCFVSTYFHNRVKTVFYKQRRLRPLDEGTSRIRMNEE